MPLIARTKLLAGCLLMMLLGCLLPAVVVKTAGASTAGGASPDDPKYRPAKKAKIVNGKAIPPKSAPKRVKKVIYAANRIVDKPYRYGGGHGSFEDSGYDCSGAVSYALHGGRFVKAPKDSSDYMSWGLAGKGKWITVYTNPGHAYMVVAGLRFDTGYRDSYGQKHGAKPGTGPRWGKPRPSDGFKSRRIRKY
jgi:hypothetical protein